jgi:hypothetical protein
LSLQQLRYGVFVDIAQRAYSGKPVAISMGYLNAVWQARPGSHSSITEHSLHGITPSKKGKSVTYVSGTLRLTDVSGSDAGATELEPATSGVTGWRYPDRSRRPATQPIPFAYAEMRG